MADRRPNAHHRNDNTLLVPVALAPSNKMARRGNTISTKMTIAMSTMTTIMDTAKGAEDNTTT